ncbi:MAG TPA: extracellular solute-binding protein, partial [Streptomyces sp.]
MIRKVSALLCAAALVTAVAGCSSTSNSSDSADSGPVTLTYGIWDPNQMPAMQKIVDAFHASHPSIKVKIQLTPNSDYWTKLQTEAASGSAPDVFWMSSTRIGLYAGQGQLQSLSDKSGFANTAFPKSLNAIYTMDGKQYGMPKDFDTVGLWYNKKLFDAAGKPHPTNLTWDQYADLAKSLTSGSGTSKVYGTYHHIWRSVVQAI